LENFPILFFIGWLCPRGKRVHNFCFVGSAPEGRDFTTSFLLPLPRDKRLYNYVLLLSLPQREETLQFCCIGSDPKGRDFAILFFGSAQREETSQFCFIESAQREQKLYNFVFFLDLPREKRLYSFDLLGLPKRLCISQIFGKLFFGLNREPIHICTL
jgi:hypothetical protein